MAISEQRKRIFDVREKIREERFRTVDFLDGGNPGLESWGLELVWKCTSCGFLWPKGGNIPERCPDCRASKEYFVLLEED